MLPWERGDPVKGYNPYWLFEHDWEKSMGDTRIRNYIIVLAACLGLSMAESLWAFGMGSGGSRPRGPYTNRGPGIGFGGPSSGSIPGYEPGSGSGSGFGAGPRYGAYPGHTGPTYGNGSTPGPGYGSRSAPMPGPHYGQPASAPTAGATATPGSRGAPAYGNPVAPPSSSGYSPAPTGYGPASYGAPNYGYSGPGYGYGSGSPAGYGYGGPGYGYGRPGYGGPGYYGGPGVRSGDGRGAPSGMTNPMKMMPNPMQMFGGNKN